MPRAVFLVGASRGIGLELAELYCLDGDIVHGIARSEAPSRRFPGFVYRSMPAEAFDLAAFPEASNQRYGLLVLNSAVFGPAPEAGLDASPEELRHVLEVNVVAHYRVLQRMRRNLAQDGSAVAAFVVSVGGLQPRIKGRVAVGYRTSKAAQIALALSLVEPCKELGISVYLVNPGWATTAIGGRKAAFSAAESAVKVKRVLASARSFPPGTLFNHDGSALKL